MFFEFFFSVLNMNKCYVLYISCNDTIIMLQQRPSFLNSNSPVFFNSCFNILPKCTLYLKYFVARYIASGISISFETHSSFSCWVKLNIRSHRDCSISEHLIWEHISKERQTTYHIESVNDVSWHVDASANSSLNNPFTSANFYLLNSTQFE